MPSTKIIILAPELSTLSYNFYRDLLNTDTFIEFLDLPSISVDTCYVTPKSSDADFDFSPFGRNLPFWLPNIDLLLKRCSGFDNVVLIVDGFRLPDKTLNNFLSSYFYSSSTKYYSIYVQHGRYTNLIRNRLFSRHLFSKLYYYSRLLIYCGLFSLKTFHLLNPFAGSSCFSLGLLYTPLTYWEGFHCTKSIYFEKIVPVSDPDFERFTVSNHRSDSILYLNQTLYEDGRCTLPQMLSFLSIFKSYASVNGLHSFYKLHPRNINRILDYDLTHYFDAEFFGKDFPCFSSVVTHNSALALFFAAHHIPVVAFNINSESLPIGLIDSPLVFSCNDQHSFSIAMNRARDFNSATLNSSSLDLSSGPATICETLIETLQTYGF